MRTMNINKRGFWFCNYVGKEEIHDINGNYSGEYVLIYEGPVRMEANISPAAGSSSVEQFGNLDNYDKVIVTDDINCPIDENTVLFVDKAPETTEIITYEEDPEEPGTYIEAAMAVPLYDYTVRRIAKSLNSVSIAIQKVSVS